MIGRIFVRTKLFFERLTVAVAALLLLALSLSLCLLPKKEFSAKERRALATFPALSLDSVMDGRFFHELSDYCADQFPLRERFLSLTAATERILGKRESNGILFGKDGYLIARGEYDDLSVANENLAAIAAFAERADVPISLSILPRSVDVLTPYLPHGYGSERAHEIGTRIGKTLPSNVDLLIPLQAAMANGTQIFYRTDHHWTTAGAYLAYTCLAPSLGIEPYPAEYFTPTPVCDSFLGTSFARSGLAQAMPDTITLYRYAGDDRYTVTNCETGKQAFGFYEMTALLGDDPYEVFLGGNFARLTVSDPTDAEKPTLLLFKDSFANSLIPFLALHFQLEIIDLRYGQASAQSILDEVRPERVLILLGADTVATTPTLGRIAR